MKNQTKITALLILTTLCFSVILGVLNFWNADATATQNGDIFVEDFSGYTPFVRDVSEGTTKFGDWSVYFDQSEAGKISLLSAEDAKQYGADGQVLRINTIPSGTDHKVMYDGGEYKVKNFIATYDFYHISGSKSSWIALFARSQDPENIVGGRNLFLHLQKGQGTSSDKVPTSDGSEREGVSGDVYFQYMSMANTGSGMTMMTEETGIERDMGRLFMTDGGDVTNKWITVKYVVRDNFAACYVKLKGESDSQWRFLGKTCYSAKEDLGAGYFGFGTCGGDYLIDNLRIKSEDGNVVNAVVDTPDDYGGYYDGKYVSKISPTSASADSDIELILSLKDGYVYGDADGVWYKDSGLSQKITTTSVKIQQLTFNDMFGKYEWTDLLSLSSLSDLENSVSDVGNTVKIGEFYSGDNYRLIVSVNTHDNGFNFYSKITKRKYYNVVTKDGEGSISSNILTGDENSLIGKLEIDTAVSLTATPETGNKFAGWYKLVYKDGETYKIRLSTDATYAYASEMGGTDIEAVFVEESARKINVKFIITLIDGESSEYGIVKTVSGDYFDGETLSLIAEENIGYSFCGWKNDGELITESSYFNYELTGVSSIIFTAEFEVEKYRIYIDNGISGKIEERTVSANSEVVLIAPTPPVGKTFSRWVIEGVGTDYVQDGEKRSVTFNATDKKIYATAYFVASTHKVVVSVADVSQGTVMGGGNKQFGETVTVSVRPKTGYAVARYTVNGTEVELKEDGTISFVMPDNDVRIRVEFSKIDEIDVKKEVISYVIFGCFIVVVVTAILFINNGDGSLDGKSKKHRHGK